jgi:hypothetical protein
MSAVQVSVALCTYQGAVHLHEQLESLLAQDLPGIELVACDDASEDGTWDILQTYAPRFARARLIRNPANLGLQANFQQALQACRGEWIAPCDQDDKWAVGKLSRLLAAAQSAGATLSYCDSALIDAAGRPMGRRVSDRYRMVSGSDPRMFTFSNCISGHATLLHRSLLAQALPVPPGVYYDWWMACVAAATGRIVYVDEPLVQFRQHGSNASSFTGAPAQRRTKGTGDSREHQTRSLEALTHLPGPHQPFFRDVLSCWTKQQLHGFSPHLACLLYHHRNVVFAMKKSSFKVRHVVKYLSARAQQ